MIWSLNKTCQWSGPPKNLNSRFAQQGAFWANIPSKASFTIKNRRKMLLLSLSTEIRKIVLLRRILLRANRMSLNQKSMNKWHQTKVRKRRILLRREITLTLLLFLTLQGTLICSTYTTIFDMLILLYSYTIFFITSPSYLDVSPHRAVSIGLSPWVIIFAEDWYQSQIMYA